MAPEEFRIKIMRNGEIRVDARGLGERRVRELREMLEEILGPITDRVELDEAPGGPAVRIVTEEGEKRYRVRGES